MDVKMLYSARDWRTDYLELIFVHRGGIVPSIARLGPRLVDVELSLLLRVPLVPLRPLAEDPIDDLERKDATLAANPDSVLDDLKLLANRNRRSLPDHPLECLDAAAQ